MICCQVESLLAGYRERSLSKDQQQRVRHHLATCDSCAQALREMEQLDAELSLEALHHRPRLSPEASVRIQERVYQQMRRGLVFQRARHLGERLSERLATAAMIMVVVAMALMIGRGAPDTYLDDGTAEVIVVPSEVEYRPPVALTATPLLEEVTAVVPATPQPSIPFAPHHTPEQLAEMVLQAALHNDGRQLQTLFSGVSGTDPQGTARVWQRLSKCRGLDLSELRYEIWPQAAQVIRVDIHYDTQLSEDRYDPSLQAALPAAAELKMRLIDGNWHIFFAPYPSIIHKCHRLGISS